MIAILQSLKTGTFLEAQTASRNSGNGSMKVTYGEDGILESTYARDAKGNLKQIIDKELTTEQLKQN
jgi:hypothetical protein